MYLDQTRVKLKAGDRILFRIPENTVHVMRGSQNLTNRTGNEKICLYEDGVLTENLCYSIANFVADSHCMEIQNMSNLYKGKSLFCFKLVRKLTPKEIKATRDEIVIRRRLRKK